MFGFNKKSKTDSNPDSSKDSQSDLDTGLKKTRSGLFSGLKNLFSQKQNIEPQQLDEIEERLLMADVGIEATTDIMEYLHKAIKQQHVTDSDALLQTLKQILVQLVTPAYGPLIIQSDHKPYIILTVGVNGVGKTTTTGKLAKRLQSEGQSVMLAAGDTFRAAAVEQLTVWGERNGISVVAQAPGSDSAAVIFDALQSARAKCSDILIADTAGRLHTKDNLMEELKKVRRVIAKFDATITPEILLVLDATTGQNALVQARQFHKDIGISGIVLSKLDGTAKGGIIFALANELQVPIRFIGLGEGIDDLKPFEPESFVSALLKIDT